MLIDARAVPNGAEIETDLCIVGGGVAGITLARELSGERFRCCLLESGGFTLEADTQELYAGESVGLPYTALNAARLRYFGGTSNHWSGWTRPLDPFDFERQDWIRYSGWPFPRAELDPYYARAFEIVETGPALAAARGPQPAAGARGLQGLGPDIENTLFWLSPPTRFGTRYREAVVGAPNVDVYLYANVVELLPNAAGSLIERVRVATLSGKRFAVKARAFVLATGGIENARVLLASHSMQSAGIGNAHGLVGRFFQDHAGVRTGSALISDPQADLDFYDYHAHAPEHHITKVGAVTFGSAALAERRMTNCTFLVREAPPIDAWGIQTLGWAVKRGQSDYVARAVKGLVRSIDDSVIDAYTRFLRPSRHRPLVRMITILAPVPNPDSTVTLTTERDPLGMPRVRLNWQLSAVDRTTIYAALDLFGRALGKAGLGRVVMTEPENGADWPPPVDWHLEHGWHHMGTTRMSENPREGVVDARCRVHGLDNLFVAGSSVFPTYGYSQPTLTIIALALRMSEDLRGLLR